jgi:hypothetical protein
LGPENEILPAQEAQGRSIAVLAAYRDVLGARLSAKSRAVLNLALSFFTWRTLVREGGLERVAAVGSWSKPSMAQTKHEAAVSLAP